MIKFDIIPVSERKNHICHICKNDKSVKYRINIGDKTFYYCNKCVWLGMADVEVEAYTEAYKN